MTTDKKTLEILLGLVDRAQSEFRRQIALAFPDITANEVVNKQVEIVNALQRAHDQTEDTIA